MVSSSISPDVPKVVTTQDCLEKFKGADFRTRHRKMLLYLTALGLAKFLDDVPSPTEGQTPENDKEIFLANDVWKHYVFFVGSTF